jgi:molybdopterin converting factor small subunit
MMNMRAKKICSHLSQGSRQEVFYPMADYSKMLHKMLANLPSSSYTGKSIEHLYMHASLWAKHLVAHQVHEEDRLGLLMNTDEKASVTLRLPSTLSTYSGGKSQIVLHANTVEEMLAQLALQHPQVWSYLCTEQGHIREHVKMFVNNEMISGLTGLKTSLKPGQEVIVLPAFFGF